MTKKFLSLCLILVLCLGLGGYGFAASNTDFVYDEADLLTDFEESVLRESLADISRAYEAQLVVATIHAPANGHVDSYLDILYDTMDFGYGENRDGVLLLVCMNPREYRILSNGYAGVAIDSYHIDLIGDAIVSDLSDGNYAQAFHSFAEECAYYLDGYRNGFPFDAGGNLLIALMIGIVSGLVVVLILKGQLKTVRKQNQANVYVKSGSMKVTVHQDRFLYRNLTRTRKESSSSSGKSGGGGGGSRSRGGGSF